MYTTLILAICCYSLFAISVGNPIFEELFPKYSESVSSVNSPNKKGDVVKRGAYEPNPDADLKEVSFQSLVSDIEHSLFNSALSVSSIAHDKDAIVPQITPTAEHELPKRQSDEAYISKLDSDVVDSRKIILQTTEKVPEKKGVPAHIVIDRVTVLPHSGGVPTIPAFQLQRTKQISATIKDQGSNSAIQITKTDIKTTDSDVKSLSSNEKLVDLVQPTKTTTTTTTTTKSPKIQLMEAEQELKEKVAEIEAEPVILSARV